jgi:hypothetical protein
MVGSEYTYCPMCGCEDGQGCSKDCPSEVIPRLLAENVKLREALVKIYQCSNQPAVIEISRAVLGDEK